MKKICLLLFCLCLTPALAEEVNAPTDFLAYTLADQHGEEHALQPETRTVIMSFDMKLSKGIHEWLATKDADYLATHQAEYVGILLRERQHVPAVCRRPQLQRVDR